LAEKSGTKSTKTNKNRNSNNTLPNLSVASTWFMFGIGRLPAIRPYFWYADLLVKDHDQEPRHP